MNLATLAAEAATRNRPVRDGLIGAGKFGLVHSLMNAAQTKKQVRINKPYTAVAFLRSESKK